jgi:succinyl-CoA synthetase beta subunit
MNDVRQTIDAARERGETVLSEFDSKRILAAYGIPVTRESLVADADAAVNAATKIGFPIVVKGCAAGLAHKTELDLVAVGLADAMAVYDAASRLLQRLPAGADVLVQEMVPGRRELMLGLIRDSQFGPCVSLGAGGIFAEALADICFRIAPFGRVEAMSMLDELKTASVYGAARGMPAVDRNTLADALAALGNIGIEHPEIREIDINPMIVTGSRPVAVDALVVLEPLGQ